MTTNKENNSEDKYYEDEFSIREFIEIVWSSKNTIISIGFLSFIFFLAFTLSKPNFYTSDTLLRVNDTESDSSISRLASSYSGLASLAGVNLQTNSNSKSNLVLATINSKEFFEHLSTFSEVLPNLYAAKGYDEEKQEVIFDADLFNPEEGGWQIPVPSPLNVHANFIEGLVVSQDQDTGFIYLSVEHISPKFAYFLCNLILQEANNLIREKQLAESYKAQEFLNKQLEKNLSMEVKKSTIQILEAQLQIQMIANVRGEYMVSPIDKPYIPLHKSGPDHFKNSFLGLLLGLGLGLLLSLIRAYFSSSK